MAIRIVRLGTPRMPGEGPRIGTVRRPPRGVPKGEFACRDFYDVWYPLLAPSARAAMVGRPWVMALAAGGEAALTRMLGLYKQDMRTALGLTGVTNAMDVGRGVLLSAP